jgi:hypothetical protein
VERLERLDGASLAEFLAAPVAVLLLARSDCEACARWTAELEDFLARDRRFAHVRFGKLVLDQRGLAEWKRANPWLAELEDLPTNVIYRGGERASTFAGSGISRLVHRLEQHAGSGAG